METRKLLAGVIEYVQNKKPKAGVLITILEPDEIIGTKITSGATHNIKDIEKLYMRLAADIETGNYSKVHVTDLADIIKSEAN